MAAERHRTTGRSSDALVADRRERMLQVVLEGHEVPIAELASTFDVSVMTVHRDLDSLVDAGLLRKSRGRAVAPSGEELQTSARFRLRAAHQVKEAIAGKAARVVEGARTVLVDDSTSVLPVLRILASSLGSELTVVTNYLQAVREVMDAGVQVHLLGGDLVPELDATFGPSTVEAVRGWHADAAIMGNPAVKGGELFHPLQGSVALKRAMLAQADQRVLVIDHTKLGHTAPQRWATGADFTDVVLDAGADARELESLRALTCTVHVADVSGSPADEHD